LFDLINRSRGSGGGRGGRINKEKINTEKSNTEMDRKCIGWINDNAYCMDRKYIGCVYKSL
jgi:hypothetical protein